MAKSARASAVKKNNQRLKKKVFGPVESARNERLGAKLLELANQPKPPRTEMEVEQRGKSTVAPSTKDTTDDETPTEQQDAAEKEGASASLSIPIPPSFLRIPSSNDQSLPTPPDTPPADATTTFPILDLPAQKSLAKELLFFHLLGASTDIVGFDHNGDLELSFANPR